MKHREGFVSNSSSTSFVVGMNRSPTAAWEEEMGVDKKSPLWKFARHFIYVLKQNKKKKFISYESYQRWVKSEGKEEDPRVKRMFAAGMVMVWVGEIGNENVDPVEAIMCEKGLNFKGKGLAIACDPY